jgi:biotin carboxylase
MTLRKNILILGVGNAQTDLIAQLKTMGHHVTGISYKEEGEALKLIDKFEKIDIVDHEKVLLFALENKYDLVYSIGSDLAMPTIGFVSAKLNLPAFFNEELANLMHNKYKFRSFLKKENKSSVSFKKASSFNDISNWDIFPAILKPVDNQGQRGVVKVMNRKELKAKFSFSLSYSRTNTVIIEEYIPGNEVSMIGYMYNGELKYSFISDRRVINGYSCGIVQGHDMPTSMPEKAQVKARKLSKEIAVSLGYLNGPIYFQMKYNNENIEIIEATPRFDGCHLWMLVNERYKINLLEIVINHLFGEDLCFPIVTEPKDKKDTIEFFLQKPGTIFNPSGLLKVKGESGFLKTYYHEGEIVRPVNGEMEKVGFQFISTPVS